MPIIYKYVHSLNHLTPFFVVLLCEYFCIDSRLHLLFSFVVQVSVSTMDAFLTALFLTVQQEQECNAQLKEERS